MCGLCKECFISGNSPIFLKLSQDDACQVLPAPHPPWCISFHKKLIPPVNQSIIGSLAATTAVSGLVNLLNILNHFSAWAAIRLNSTQRAVTPWSSNTCLFSSTSRCCYSDGKRRTGFFWYRICVIQSRIYNSVF